MTLPPEFPNTSWEPEYRRKNRLKMPRRNETHLWAYSTWGTNQSIPRLHLPVCHHACHLQNKGKWTCQCLTLRTPVLLSLADHRQVHLPRNWRIQFLQSKHIIFQSISLRFFFLLFSSPHFLPPESINIAIFQNSKEPCFSRSSDILRGCIKSLSSFSTLHPHLVPQLAPFTLGFFSDEPVKCSSVPSPSFP